MITALSILEKINESSRRGVRRSMASKAPTSLPRSKPHKIKTQSILTAAATVWSYDESGIGVIIAGTKASEVFLKNDDVPQHLFGKDAPILISAAFDPNYFDNLRFGGKARFFYYIGPERPKDAAEARKKVMKSMSASIAKGNFQAVRNQFFEDTKGDIKDFNFLTNLVEQWRLHDWVM